MQIQINSPHAPVSAAFSDHMETSLRSALAPYERQLTRVEVHLRDLNANKGGIDKRCVIEARLSGLDPVAADHESDGLREAFKGALEKLERVLQHKLGKRASRNHGG